MFHALRSLLQPIKLTAAANNSLIKQAPVAAPLPPPRLPCSTLMSFPDLIQTENPPSNKQLQVVNRVKSGVSKNRMVRVCVVFCFVFFSPSGCRK